MAQSRFDLSDIDPFPEDVFAAPPSRLRDYKQRCALGRRNMSKRSAVICGLARDIVATAETSLRIAEIIGEQFGDCRILVVENDSTDGTGRLLSEWANARNNVTVISRVLDEPRWGSSLHPDRFAQLARHRNVCVEWVRYNADDADCVIIFDFDLHKGVSIEGLQNSFGFDGWDAMFSNGISAPIMNDLSQWPMFFDALPFRFPGQEIAPDMAETNALGFRRGSPPVRVWSAFGGLAAYRREAFLCGARYEGGECEHVAFHRTLRLRGFDELFMNPSQIVFY